MSLNLRDLSAEQHLDSFVVKQIKESGADVTAPMEPLPPDMDESRLFAELLTHNELRNAALLGYTELRTYQVTDMTGKVRAVEALARWQHPRLGLVLPAKFIGLAVETGLIVSIDRWVLQTASRQLHDWRREIATANRLDTIPASDAERALCLWVNSPGNPTGTSS